MAIFGISYQIIPTTSLTLNLIVTSIGVINFWRNGHGRMSLIVPFMVTSIPSAYLAGTLILSKDIFQLLLLMTLMVVVIRIYFLNNLKFSFQLSGVIKWVFYFKLGSCSWICSRNCWGRRRDIPGAIDYHVWPGK